MSLMHVSNLRAVPSAGVKHQGGGGRDVADSIASIIAYFQWTAWTGGHSMNYQMVTANLPRPVDGQRADKGGQLSTSISPAGHVHGRNYPHNPLN